MVKDRVFNLLKDTWLTLLKKLDLKTILLIIAFFSSNMVNWAIMDGALEDANLELANITEKYNAKTCTGSYKFTPDKRL